MRVKLTILGSGTSHGIPMIGCTCAVCTSDDPRDRRTRTAAVFSFDGRRVLVDTPPELRLQCVANGIDHIDAICFTHAHADHIVGLDDVRRFNDLGGTALPIYGDADTLTRITTMFAYAFRDDPDYPSHKPTLLATVLDGPLRIGAQEIVPIPYWHGPTRVLGYRVGRIAYCPDCNHLPAEARALLTGLDVLVLDGLRRRPHPTHFNLEQAVAVAHEIGARQTYFTHIAHELKHAETCAELPAGMSLAYDGLEVEA